MDVWEAFTQIAMAEKFHETRYLSLLKSVQEGKVFKKDSPVTWHCRNCGYVFEGKEASEKCPACKHSKSYLEVLADNY